MSGRDARGAGGSGGDDPAEVLLEFQRIGNVVKVTAVDPATMVEVSIVGDAAASEAVLRRTAIQKLRYVLDKRRPKAAPTPRRGDLV